MGDYQVNVLRYAKQLPGNKATLAFNNNNLFLKQKKNNNKAFVRYSYVNLLFSNNSYFTSLLDNEQAKCIDLKPTECKFFTTAPVNGGAFTNDILLSRFSSHKMFCPTAAASN